MTLRHLPNILCVFRIGLVPPVLWAIERDSYALALGLFVVAGVTDALDGFLARQFDWRSDLGAFLDPAADKLLMVTVLVWLVLAGLVPLWLAAVLIGRDIVIVTGALSYRAIVGPFKGQASFVSKINTVGQLAFVTLVLSHAAFAFPDQVAVAILGSLVFVTAVVSGMGYVRDWTLLAVRSGSSA